MKHDRSRRVAVQFAWVIVHIVVFVVTLKAMASSSVVAHNLAMGGLVCVAAVGTGAAVLKPARPLGPTLLRLGRTSLVGFLCGMLVRSWSGL